MKLGSETNSLTNHLLSRAVIGQPEPTVGMGATILCWTDRHPATIVAIVDGILTVQEDNHKRIDSNGMSESQDYEYTRNPTGATYYFRAGKDGKWQEVVKNENTGRWNRSASAGLRIGEREKYHDFSF